MEKTDSSGAASAPKVLSVEGLRKTYGVTVAVAGVTFDVRLGEIVGLLGPNGAGKTTTINMILGVLEPTAGAVFIEGLDVRRERSPALGRTNFAAVYAPLPGNLTVKQSLRIFGMIYGVARPFVGARHTRAHARVRRRGRGRRALDFAQHVRGRGGLRPRALPLEGAHPARRRPACAPARARARDARRAF